MKSESFARSEIEAFEKRGITADEARRQIDLFREPPGFTRLERPCVPGDGIRILTDDEKEKALVAYRSAREANRLGKMVPASGAASRMFQSLLRFHGVEPELSRAECGKMADSGDGAAADLLAFMDGLSGFAFRDQLAEEMAARGDDLHREASRFHCAPVLDALLSVDRLGFASLPKGLIPFHAYGDERRTPFEEHLVEGALYGRNGDGRCPIHFTVPVEFRSRFEELLREVRPGLEDRFGVRFDVRFSVQKKSTDTLAVDPENRLFRLDDGSILFRPGGHGALIENLNDLRGDIVLIKNIDNVSPRQLSDELTVWKKYLAGHLAGVQEALFRHTEALEDPGRGDGAMEAARAFAAAELNIDPAAAGDGREGARSFLLERFRRPVRVCGMVINEGEPGGGPFWVRSGGGEVTPQIVETAQVDRDDPDQRALHEASTHFNPVDLVCGVRDRRGEPYDLTRFVDEKAVFVSEKSKGGRPLKALERPGLWNGAMAFWNTIFVEVPAETFSPVKKVVDLLGDAHRP